MSFRLIMPARRWTRGLLTVLLIGSGEIARADGTTAGTMPEDYVPGLRPILAVALKQSPSMIANELQIAVADAQRMSSGVAPMLPSIGGSAQYGDSTQAVASNSAYTNSQKGLFYSANISQPVFQWRALKNQLEVQKAAELITEKNYADGYRNFVASLRHQYLALIVAKINLRNARYGLKLSQDALALANDKLKRGTIAAGDIAIPQLDVEEKQLDLDRADEGYDFARRALAHEIGEKDIDDAAIPLAIPEPKYSPDLSAHLLADLLRDGARNTFAAQIDELYIRQSDLQYKIAAVRLLPKFSATAGYSKQNQTTASANSITSTVLTTEDYFLTANWTLFDGLATHYVKLQALTYKHYYERQLQIVTDSIMDQAQNSQRSVDFAWRAMNLANRRWQMANGGLSNTLNEFKLGNVSQDTVADSTYNLYTNDSANASARADFLSTWSDFVSLVGADPAMNNLPAHYVRDIR